MNQQALEVAKQVIYSEFADILHEKAERVALAVRKAVLAAQLEPSEEERAAALSAWFADGGNDRTAMRTALRAAARVRLEKAEGEQ